MMGLGQRGEDLAAEHYERLGYKLVDRNYFYHKGKLTGELDLVFVKEKCLVVVEVKTRKSPKFGTPYDSVDLLKQKRLVKTAKLFQLTHPEYADYGLRIDVAGVDIDNPSQPVKILENAVDDIE